LPSIVPDGPKLKESSMNIVRMLAGNRREFCIGLLGLVALVSGCGDGASTLPPVAPGGLKPGEAEAKARMKAYGTTGMPKSTKGSPKTQ
jgi:hypothetical protein